MVEIIRKKNKIIFILFLLVSLSAGAQYKSYWYVQPTLGLPIFYGDVKQNNTLPGKEEWTLGYGIKAGRQITYVTGVNLNIYYGKLKGQNKRFDKKFTADYYETVANTTINISNLLTWDKSSYKKVSFNAIVGIGYAFYNSALINYTTGDTLRKIGYGNGAGFKGRTLEGIYILGVDFTYNINKNFEINFETAYRVMISDALDGSETGYHNDGYNFTSLSLTWKFGLTENIKRNNRLKEGKKFKVKKKKTGIKHNYKGYKFKKGEKWLNNKKQKKDDKYNKFRNRWK